MARTGRPILSERKKTALKKAAGQGSVANKATAKKTATKVKKPAAAKKLAVLAGGCLCGEIRYRLTPLSADVDFCHCAMCQRWSGAPVSAWAQVPASQFRLVKGTPTPYASSKVGIRYFCPTCGASVFMTDAAGVDVGVMLGTLDDPEALRPTAHGWWSARLSWLKLDDKLARWPKDPPYDV